MDILHEQKPLISVIVPVYNVEKYLDRCLKSITEQTYSELEVILVDDGSEDHSSELCDKWSFRDSRIRVIHKQNGGLSSARNVGMDNAIGEYISFIDSDDYIMPEMYEVLLNSINGADLAVFSYLFESYSKGVQNRACPYQYENDVVGQKHLLKMAFESVIPVCAWTYFIKTSLLKKTGLRFPEGRRYEDTVFIYTLLNSVQYAPIINKPLYIYCQNSSSITSNPNVKDVFDLFFNLEKLRGIFVEWESENSFYAYQCTALMFIYEIYLKSKSKDVDIQRRIYAEYHTSFNHLQLARLRPMKKVVKYVLMELHLYELLVRLRRN